MATDAPQTQYVMVGVDCIAYQVFGNGEIDLLWVPATADCIELRWDWPPYAEFLRWLGARVRVIAFDRRGTGASDPASGDALPLWEQWAEDARAVLDAVGSERAVVCGVADSGAAAILFASSHASRTQGLILINTHAGNDMLGGSSSSQSSNDLAAYQQFVLSSWGTMGLADYVCPDVMQTDPLVGRWFAKNQRLYMTPTAAGRILHQSVDVRPILDLVRVPTLVIHREEFAAVPVENGQFLADHIEGASLTVVPGRDGWIFTHPADQSLQAIDEFLGGHAPPDDPDRELATILFTDIVGSTEQAGAVGDRAWREVLASHDAVARRAVAQHNGRVIKTTGDGVLATFSGPGRGIRCALAMQQSLRTLGLEIRAGLHTGEVEVMGDDIAGIGVHIASRVLNACPPGDVFVSPAIPMLVAGAGFVFESRGEQVLKGVSGTWNLYSVTPSATR